MKNELYLILDNIRSLYNVGSIFRIADCVGVRKIYITGITPYPTLSNDPRKPWEIERIQKQLHKTALGAELSIPWAYYPNIDIIVKQINSENIPIFILESNEISKNIYSIEFPNRCALIVGNEIYGVNQSLINQSTKIIHIPMVGIKESLNVSTATSIACYEWYRQVHIENRP